MVNFYLRASSLNLMGSRMGSKKKGVSLKGERPSGVDSNSTELSQEMKLKNLPLLMRSSDTVEITS